MRPSPWLLPVLILLLLAGHLCDVAALVDVRDAHHESDGHLDDAALGCDGVGLRPAAVKNLPPPTLAVAMAQPIGAASAPAYVIASPRPDSSPPAQRPRLFLLFASLLI